VAHRKLTLAWNSEPPLVWHFNHSCDTGEKAMPVLIRTFSSIVVVCGCSKPPRHPPTFGVCFQKIAPEINLFLSGAQESS